MQTRDIMRQAGVIPVLTFDSIDQALSQSEALVAGGLNTLEITLRTPVGLDCIREVKAALPHAIVGAGTVTNREQMAAVQDAGAEFCVTPGATASLWKYASENNVNLLAGTATISEVLLGREYGFDAFKFFPAEANGGAATLKSFAGPLGSVWFCPTGGVKPSNIGDYLALPTVPCVGGTWLTPKGATPAEIEQLAREARELSASAT